MDDRCSLKQIAKAVIFSAMDPGWEDYLMEHENPSILKSLDTFISTVYIFASMFDVKYEAICRKYKKIIPKEQFGNFLDPRCEILAEGNGYYELLLSCSFVREMVHKFRIYLHCFHFDLIAYNCLIKFLERRFECLESDNWSGLLDYCREINIKIDGYRHHNVPLPIENSAGSNMSDEYKFNEEWDEHAFVRTAHFKAITPPLCRLSVLKRIKKCETGFECEFQDHGMTNVQTEHEHSSSSAGASGDTDKNSKSEENIEDLMDDSSEKIQASVLHCKVSSQNDPDDCLECKNLCSFKVYRENWRMEIHKLYNNWNLVSDYFDKKESDDDSSSS